MGITVIYGKAGSGKSTRIFQDMKEKWKTGKKIYLITPEQFSYTAEKRMLEEWDKEAVLQAEVVTFQRMAQRLMQESKEQEKQRLSTSGKAMLIASILLDEKKNLKFLGKSDENIDLIQKQLKEFKKHGVTVSDLEKVWETEEEPYLKAKVQDMLHIYKNYEKRIEKEYLDEDDALSILLEQLEENHSLDGAYFYFDEFAGFTKQEYLVIGKSMERAEEVTIAICTDKVEKEDLDETDLFYESKKTIQRILQLAQERNIEKVQYIQTENEQTRPEELVHLSQNLYSSSYQVYKKPINSLSLFLASNAYTEIEYVAEQIYTLVSEHNLRYQDIAIITKDLENYGSICSVILNRYNIPFFIDEKRDLSQNILIKYVISLFDVFAKKWSYEAVLSYIKMDFFDLEDDEIYRLQEYALKWGIRGNKWYQGNWKMLKDQKEPEKILRARKIVIEPLAELKEKLVRKTVKEISSSLYQFLIDQKIDQKMDAKRRELEEKGLLELAKEYQNSWKILMELLDELVFLFGEEKIGLERYMQLLKVGLKNRSLGKIPVAQDQVTIGDVDRSKSHGIKAIFMIGLNDGIFPAVYQSEGFFDDKDREKLKKYQVELAKGTKERLYEDRFNGYKAFSVAEEKLFLSYVSSNLEGATLRPSVFIGRIKRIFPELKEESDLIQKQEKITTQSVTFEALLSQIRNAMEGEELTKEWLGIFEYYQNHPNWKDKLENAMSAILYSALPENIVPENVEKLYGDKVQTSVSKLEQYSSCAFSYYLTYALKLKEQEEAKVQAMDTGSFLHELIDRFFVYIKEEGIPLKQIDEKQIEEIVKALVNEKLQLEKNYIFTVKKKYQFLVVRLSKLLKTALLHIIDSLRESNFEVLGNEISFQKGKQYPPIEITLPNGKKLELEGKIDRADFAKTEEGTYLRIIDYKSSVKNLDLNEVEYGLQLQLFTYLDAMCKKEDFLPAGVLYFSLIDPIIKAEQPLEKEEIEEEIRKRFKMQGFVLADVKVIKMMDNNLEAGNSSSRIPVYFDKEGKISSSRSNCLTKEQFEGLEKQIEKTIQKIGMEMMQGNIQPNPYYQMKNQKTPCQYCPYHSICQIDDQQGQISYRYIPNKKKEEILEKLEERKEV